MKAVEVKEQVSLPLGKCMELVLSGIQYRIFRAAITVTIIALAVAFLMTMLSESIIARRVAQSVDAQTAPRRLFVVWDSRLSAPLALHDLVEQLAAAGKDSPRWQELAAWGKLGGPEMDTLKSLADEEVAYAGFFNDLNDSQRRLLVGGAGLNDVFGSLSSDAAFRAFEEKFKVSDFRLPRGKTMQDFKTFLAQRKGQIGAYEKILKGQAATLPKVKKLLGDRTAREALAQLDDALIAKLTALGYRFGPGEAGLVRQQAALQLDTDRIRTQMDLEIVKQGLANQKNIELITDADMSVYFGYLNSSAGAKWLASLSAEDGYLKAAEKRKALPLNVAGQPRPVAEGANRDGYQKKLDAWVAAQAARILEVAANQSREEELRGVEASVRQSGGADSDGIMGFSPRVFWLILVSFMVCIVGIANAMLMSVTERFREIATMKCLGATDQFIMINFILESIMQGVAGGIVGALLGLLLGALRSWWSFGAIAFHELGSVATSVLITAGVSMAVGIVVSALAAVYPAYVAARLAPMEAMRIE